MPHAIDTTTGAPAIFVAGTAPWHGLGRQVKEAVNSDQAIKLAGLTWLVEQWPVDARRICQAALGYGEDFQLSTIKVR